MADSGKPAGEGDAVRGKRDGKNRVTSVYAALCVTFEGKKKVSGLWTGENEGAKFRMSVLTQLKRRDVNDILIACTGGPAGFPDAVRAVYPDTHIQKCIVHMVRNSVKYVSCKENKEVCNGLKQVYCAPDEKSGRDALEDFGKKREGKSPVIYRSRDTSWHDFCEFYNYPPEIRRAVYTTNAIGPLNFRLRKVNDSRLTLVNDEAILKVLFLAIRNASGKWTMPVAATGKPHSGVSPQ